MDYTEHTLFTPSEIMLDRLATKCNWTEAEFQEVIDLVTCLQFKVDEVGLDLGRRVSCNDNFAFNFEVNIVFSRSTRH